MTERRSVASYNIPENLLDILDDLVAKRKYASRTQIVITALNEFLVAHNHMKPQPESKFVTVINNTTTI